MIDDNAVRRAVKKLGGVRDTAAALTERGIPVGKSTVSDWCVRGEVFRGSHALALADLTGETVEALTGTEHHDTRR